MFPPISRRRWLAATAAVCGSPWLPSSGPRAACAAPPEPVAPDSSPGGPVDVGDRACLFLDDRFVASRSGLARTWHAGEPVPDVALEATEPWEDWPHLFGSVVFDPVVRRYLMWYQVLNPRVKQDGGNRYFICLAESTDGKQWTKPKLGLVSFGGDAANNIVRPEEAELPNVFLDPRDPDPARRFKMLAWLRPGNHTLFGSADGRRWTKLGPGVPSPDLMPVDERITSLADTNVVIYDPLGERYLSAYRTYPRHAHGFFKGGHRRGVGISVSPRLTEGWSPIRTTLRADGADDARVARLARAGDSRPDWSEPYILAPFAYGNHYLGLVSLLDYVDGDDLTAGAGDLQLAFSHDGLRWMRPERRSSAVRRGPNDEDFPTYAAVTPPVVVDGRLWQYYTEANGAHPAKPVARSRIRAAAWRIDGFASLSTTGTEAAVLTTQPVTGRGTELSLNAEVGPEGSIVVELLDADGRPLAGRTAAEAVPIRGDATALRAAWNEAGRQTFDLGCARDQPTRLRLTLRNARLYAFRFGDARPR
jgi:hypothetical protein